MKTYWIAKLVIIILLSFSTKLVEAHHKIYSPRVEEGRQSFEWRGHFDLDDREAMNKSHHHVLETEYSWTRFWQSELEFHISDKKNLPLDWEKTEFQNQLQIFDQQSFAAALYFSYNFVSISNKADELEYKFLSEYKFENFSFTNNLIFEKQVGDSAEGSTEFSFSNYFFHTDPIYKNIFIGIIGFSEIGEINNFKTFHNQEHQYGFQLNTEMHIKDVEYEFAFGYLHGLTDSSANHTFLWNIEIEL